MCRYTNICLNSRFIDESIPWLVANKKTKQAEQILRKAAKINGITLPDHIFSKEDMSLSQINGDHENGATDALLSDSSHTESPGRSPEYSQKILIVIKSNT